MILEDLGEKQEGQLLSFVTVNQQLQWPRIHSSMEEPSTLQSSITSSEMLLKRRMLSTAGQRSKLLTSSPLPKDSLQYLRASMGVQQQCIKGEC